MPHSVINIVLKEALNPGDTLMLSYPEGKTHDRFYGSSQHTLSFDAIFFRAPTDFSVIFHKDAIEITWQRNQTIPAQTLTTIQLDEPMSADYVDDKTGQRVHNMFKSQLFVVDLKRPLPTNPERYVRLTTAEAGAQFPITAEPNRTMCNTVVACHADARKCTFVIHGLDLYNRPLTEHIPGVQADIAEGNKAFQRVYHIELRGDPGGAISVGTGDKLGLPVFLPGSGFLLRYMVNGRGLTGGIIIPGYSGPPGPDTGDVRGTFTPPEDIALDGLNHFKLMCSLFNPSHTGQLDYAEPKAHEAAQHAQGAAS